MKTIVCVKQVPASNKVKMDPETNTIIRDGVESKINPYDKNALEAALATKENNGGTITAISMGIPSVKSMLQEVMSLGVDETVLLTDRKFAGADTLATAYVLVKAISHISDYNLIICGKMATDGDTAQVGPMIAEMLGIPVINNVSEIVDIDDERIVCKKVTDYHIELVETTLPALITVLKDINVPRLPSLPQFIKTCHFPVLKWGADQFEIDEGKIGLNGSPTQVVKTFVPDSMALGLMIEGSASKQAKDIRQILTKLKISHKENGDG